MVNTVFTLVSVTACLWNGHGTDFIALGALVGFTLCCHLTTAHTTPSPPTGALSRTSWTTDTPSVGPGRHVWLCHLDDRGSAAAGEASGL